MRVIRHLVGLDEVARAQFLRRYAELVRACVDQPLEHISRLRPPRAAIGVNGNRMGVDPTNARVERVDMVAPGRHRSAEPGDVWREHREISAKIAEDVDPERHEAPLGIERHLRRRHIVAPLSVADEMLAAVGEPADGTSQSPRRLENERIFAIEHVFGAEAAAHVLGDDAQICGLDLEDLIGDKPLEDVDALAPGVEREPAGLRVIFTNGGARLHIVRDRSRVDDSDANRVRCAGERLIRLLFVADMGVVSDVTGRPGEDERRIRPKSRFHVRDRG